MINLSDYPIFNRNIATLKETSKDEDHEVYMTESIRPVIHFDKVKEEYIKELKLVEIPKSNDALFDEDDKGSIVFVEFKNGTINNYELRKKIYDSVLIFTDITSSSISSMRKTVKYILVYNDSKVTEDRTEVDKEIFVEPSESYDTIAKATSKYAKKPYVKFGVNVFKNYCFKDVRTCTKEEFEAYLEQSDKHDVT